MRLRGRQRLLEAKAALSEFLLNRALKRRKNLFDRIATRLVLMATPEIDHGSVGEGRRGVVDHPLEKKSR